MATGWVLLSLFLTVGLVTGASLHNKMEAPERCCVPQQWEANVGGMVGYNDPKTHASGMLMEFIKMSYDEKSGQIAMDEYITTNGKPMHLKLIMNYSKHRMYMIEDSGCTYQDMPGDFQKFCVPDNATFVGHFRIGLPEKSVSMNSWMFPVASGPGESYMVSAGFTEDECLLASDLPFGRNAGVDFMGTFGVTDPTLGIKDPSVFDAPAGCKPGKYSPNTHLPKSSLYLRSRFL